MLYIVLGILVLLVLVGVITFLYHKKTGKGIEAPKVPDEECCGAHEVCEKLQKQMKPTIQYFEDEELDNYAGRGSDSYNDNEIDQFRDVLYTLKAKEVEDWLISLEKRHIELPDILRPEAWNMLE